MNSRKKYAMGFEKLVELFVQNQTAMQMQVVRYVDTTLVVRNWLFGRYILEFTGQKERPSL